MNAIHGIYHNRSIELSEQPSLTEPVEVLVIFPEPRKGVKKVGGLCKDVAIDYQAIESDLRQLRKGSVAHLLQEADSDYGRKSSLH